MFKFWALRKNCQGNQLWFLVTKNVIHGCPGAPGSFVCPRHCQSLLSRGWGPVGMEVEGAQLHRDTGPWCSFISILWHPFLGSGTCNWLTSKGASLFWLLIVLLGYIEYIVFALNLPLYFFNMLICRSPYIQFYRNINVLK